MTATSRGRGGRAQINVPLGDEHWRIALLQLAIREGKSVPDLLRPVIIGHIKRQLAADAELAAAVASLERSQLLAQGKQRRRRKLAEVKALPSGGRRGGKAVGYQERSGALEAGELPGPAQRARKR